MAWAMAASATTKNVTRLALRVFLFAAAMAAEGEEWVRRSACESGLKRTEDKGWRLLDAGYDAHCAHGTRSATSATPVAKMGHLTLF